jgi:hypothetical protein
VELQAESQEPEILQHIKKINFSQFLKINIKIALSGINCAKSGLFFTQATRSLGNTLLAPSHFI